MEKGVPTHVQIGANRCQISFLKYYVFCSTVTWGSGPGTMRLPRAGRSLKAGYIPHFQVWCCPHTFLFLWDSYKICWLRSFWLQNDISRLILRHFQNPPLSVCKRNVLLEESQLKGESKQRLLPNTDCHWKEIKVVKQIHHTFMKISFLLLNI